MNKLIDILSLDENEIVLYIASLGEKKFRGQQIFLWLHQKGIKDFNEMSNIPKSLIEKLSQSCYLPKFSLVKTLSSAKDPTKKFLFELSDGQRIESVFMSYRHGNSVCISSQAGCRMGCQFCASTVGGLIRNLEPSEMLQQIYEIEKLTEEKVSNVVIMGTGEPFDNYDNLLIFLENINSKNGRNIGSRSITISTCGIVPKIIAFADRRSQVNLAISLHAPNDELRKQLMPIGNKYDLKSLIESCKYYIDKTNRRITFEYSLIQNENDSQEMALQLARLLRGLLCHVNLIPVNHIEGKDYQKSDDQAVQLFKLTLEKQGITVTIRRSLGADVDAACGQLRNNNLS